MAETDPAHWEEPRKPKRWPIIIGAIVTFAWVTFLTIYCSTMLGVFAIMPPNEFGDFLAGAFAPLAFLWLVLGFWQQGQELRHSADALRLQGRELHHSVEQQRQLVEVTREQLAFERDLLTQERDDAARQSQPILAITPGASISNPPDNRLYTMVMVNHGRPCTDVRIEISDYPQMIRKPALGSGEIFEFRLDLPKRSTSEHIATVYFRDERLRDGMKQFLLTKEDYSWTVKTTIDGYDTT